MEENQAFPEGSFPETRHRMGASWTAQTQPQRSDPVLISRTTQLSPVQTAASEQNTVVIGNCVFRWFVT